MPGRRRLMAAASAVVLATATVLTLATGPANALTLAFVHPTSWAYTDSASPAHSFTDPALAAQVGTWSDNHGKHTSRSYFTWDVSTYSGATIEDASVVLAETSVNDCSAARRIEIWQTDTPGRPITWNHPATEERLLFSGVPDGDLACPTPELSLNITDAVRRAVAGNGILSLEVRVPGAQEHNIHFGRSLNNSPGLEIAYNHAPDTPTDVSIAGATSFVGVNCGSDPIYVNSLQPTLRATLTDADADPAAGNSGDPLTGIFDIWPTSDPSAVTEMSSGFAGYSPADAEVGVPAGVLVDNGEYVMRVKANDREADSPWSPACQFVVDVTPPTVAPTVTSTDYPPVRLGPGSGGPGITGTFTFSGGGDPQIVGFYYAVSAGLDAYVAADQPGGTATVQITPRQPGPLQLDVAGVDRAQNRGPTTIYRSLVMNNAPTVTDANTGAPLGQPQTITFTSKLTGSVAFVYTLNSGQATTVPAADDGTANITITPDQTSNTLTVHSVRSDGLASWEASYSFTAAP